MLHDKKCSTILEKLLELYKNYSIEYRATTQPYRLEERQRQDARYLYNPADITIRESLIEHVGSLPIVASFLFPYLDDDSVDLGRALTMLAIHDIGETVTGDQITFLKDEEDQNEKNAALELLHPMYRQLYGEVEEQTTPTGKFAKSVDKLTPDILDLITPRKITEQRLKHFLGEEKDIVELVTQHKHPFMLWNPFLTEFHLEIIKRLKEKYHR